MGNTSSNEQAGRRPTSGGASPLSLSQLGRDDALLIPVAPHHTIDEIIDLVQHAGEARVELLVPDGTTALQSIAGVELLRDAARAAGVRVALYTADEQTSRAARIARLEVVNVGSAVAAPQPGDKPRRPTGQRRAVVPPAESSPRTSTQKMRRPDSSAQPPLSRLGAAGTTAAAASIPPQPAVSRGPDTPAGETPPPSAGAAGDAATSEPALPASDAEFLSQLAALDQSAPPPADKEEEPPAWLRRSDEGALMFDAEGDVGVPRPAQRDPRWQDALGELDSTAGAPGRPAHSPAAQRRQQRFEQRINRVPQPTFWGALTGMLPRRAPKAPPAQPTDTGMRMTRPTRTPEEQATRQRQSRRLTLWPALVFVALLLGTVAILWSQGTFSGIGAQTLVIAPPLRTAEATEFTDLIVPLTDQPIDANSLSVQGALLSAQETVVVEGTATGQIVAPIGFGRGTIILRNRSSQPITIPAGEILVAGGQEFEFESSVTVPARVDTEVGTTFGVAEATLVARTPGAQGNIPPGTIVAPPQRFSGNLTVSQPNPFNGGTDQQVTVVSPDDVSNVLSQALSQLYARGVRAIQAQVDQRPGYRIIEGSDVAPITPTEEELRQKFSDPTQLAVFPPIGQVAQDNRFTLQLTETFTALAVPADQSLDEQLRRAVTAQVHQQRPDLTGATIQITGWERAGDSLRVDAIAVPSQEYLPVSDELIADIEANIRGRPRAEAQAYLDELRARGQIGDFQLPEDWQTIPERVRIDVRPPAAPAP